MLSIFFNIYRRAPQQLQHNIFTGTTYILEQIVSQYTMFVFLLFLYSFMSSKHIISHTVFVHESIKISSSVQGNHLSRESSYFTVETDI